MKKPRYIKNSNLPPRLGLQTALIWWIALDHFNAPVWLYGVVGTLYTLFVIDFIHLTICGVEVDLFAEPDK